MRMSRMFSKTLREAPTGADTKGYEYLLRAGYIRQMGAGIFSLLPLGYRATVKIENIIREEMDRIGAEELLMPVVNPADIWKETGRFYSIDKEMGRFKDRNNRDMVLAMTHEEAVTDLARNLIDSYKRRQPIRLYGQFHPYRDDSFPFRGPAPTNRGNARASHRDAEWHGRGQARQEGGNRRDGIVGSRPEAGKQAHRAASGLPTENVPYRHREFPLRGASERIYGRRGPIGTRASRYRGKGWETPRIRTEVRQSYGCRKLYGDIAKRSEIQRRLAIHQPLTDCVLPGSL